MRISWSKWASAATVLVAAGPALALETKGIDAAHDEALVQELSRYGMDSLLERFFEVSGATQDQQASVRSMMSIRTLLSSGDKLSAAERQQMVRKIVLGADTILPTLRDPKQLMQLASALITSGMERSANTIEYWGENPRSQAELRPVAELVAKVLDLCAARARENADKLVGSFGNNPTQAQLREYTALDNLATTASYSRLMADYYRAMSLPPKDPKRAAIAEEAIEGLKEYDSTDSQIQPLVRLRIGKLQMVKGDYAAAKKMLQSVATNANNEIEPAPDVLQQYEARYFSAVTDVLAGNHDAAAEGIAQLKAWQASNLPAEKAVRDGAAASLAMLEYRLEAQKAAALPEAQRPAALAKANSILQQLAQSRPELRGAIYEQLVKSLADDAPVKGLDTVMLQALVQRGVSEQAKGEQEKADTVVLDRAVLASRELLTRGDGSPAVLDDVAIVLPQLLEKLGRNPEAAKAYLDYAQTGKNAANRPAAMTNALAAIGRMRTADPESAEVDQLLDRALPMAVKQFNRRELAYDLARRLHRDGEIADAIAMYNAVPRDDARAMVADFHRMQAMKQELDASAASEAKKAKLEELRRFAEELRRSAASARAAATAESERTRAGLIETRARLMTASILKDVEPARAVQVLEGLEQSIATLPGADDLEAEALFLRIQCLMATGRNTEATDSLLQLLQTKAGDQGAAIIFSLLTRLDQDLEIAKRAGDGARAKGLLDARAALSGPLVAWARDNKDERIRKYTYQYMVFDAATKQQAAMAEGDVAKRVAQLRETLGLYDKLLEGPSIQMWSQTVDATKVDVKYGDVAVLLAKAQVLFELADYKQAAQRFGRLLEDRKLGMPRMIQVRDGEVATEDNPQYWEATFKLYRSNVQIAKDPATAGGSKLLEETANGLKRLYIREGEGVGGEKWKTQFEQLRREIIPDWQPGA